MKEILPWVLGLAVVAALAWAMGRSRGPSEARQWVADGAVLVDVRSPAEFASGHIEGAINVPVDQVASRVDAIGPADKAVVVYCRSGGRSAAATATLKAKGRTRVFDLGPMSAW